MATTDQNVAALRAFVTTQLAAVHVLNDAAHNPLVPAYRGMLANAASAAAAAAVTAGLDMASAVALGASIAVDVDLARQAIGPKPR